MMVSDVGAAAATNRTILVCCHKTCSKQGAIAIFAMFQQLAPSEFEVRATGCFGECGSGPMVKILPAEIWYAHVCRQDVSTIIQQHLMGNRPVRARLYRKFHPETNQAIAPVLRWLLFFLLPAFIGGICWLFASQTSLF
jgi:(2Fe-2S) ferredoxin